MSLPEALLRVVGVYSLQLGLQVADAGQVDRGQAGESSCLVIFTPSLQNPLLAWKSMDPSHVPAQRCANDFLSELCRLGRQCRLRVRVLIVILQVFLTFTAATVIWRGNFTKDSKTAYFLKILISPAFSLSRHALRLSSTLPRFSPILPDSPRLSPTLPRLSFSWFPFAVECEVAFPRFSPTLPQLSPDSPPTLPDSPRLFFRILLLVCEKYFF